jgi:16S rRNA (adenine1518-N6/adenine1519-N6)-dimethyltransferase
VGLLVFFSLVDVLPIDADDPVDFLAPGVLSLAVMSTAMVNLAISTGFERQYLVLKRLGTTPLGRPALLAAKTVAVVVVELVQLRLQLGVGAERRVRQRLGQDRRLRVRRQLEHQHRQRLLRRAAVHPEHVARVRRQRHAQPGEPGGTDRRGQARPGGAGLGRLAGLHGQAGDPLSLLDPTSVRRIAAQLDLRPTKQRGQNFVTDANTVRRIVAASGVGTGDAVLEIGPGLGSLTLGLLEAADVVVAVEIDELLAGQLPATVAARMPERAEALRVITADALRVTELPVQPTVVVANLPYNVSVPVLLHLLATFPSWQRGLVMVQLEVADRLVAGPGSKTYGVPSVKMAWYAESARVGTVPPSVFWPVPNVESGLVAIRRRPAPETSATREQVFAVVDAAFAQRRKMLRSALSGLFGSSAAASEALVAADVDPQARGEMLQVGDFARIAEQVALLGPRGAGPG